MKKNNIFPFDNGGAEKELEDIEYEAEGVGFIKSRKADSKIMDMAEKMIRYAAEDHRVAISDVIVDGSAAVDVDRKSIDHLVEEMERDDIIVVFVRNITDITDDIPDLIKFMNIAKDNGVSIFDMSRGCKVSVEPPAEFGC